LVVALVGFFVVVLLPPGTDEAMTVSPLVLVTVDEGGGAAADLDVEEAGFLVVIEPLGCAPPLQPLPSQVWSALHTLQALPISHCVEESLQQTALLS
jgi:hypothetical protein